MIEYQVGAAAEINWGTVNRPDWRQCQILTVSNRYGWYKVRRADDVIEIVPPHWLRPVSPLIELAKAAE